MARITQKMERDNPDLAHRIRMRDPAYARQYERDQIDRHVTDEMIAVFDAAKKEMGKDGEYIVVAPELKHLRPKHVFLRFKTEEQRTQFWKIVNAKRPGLDSSVNEGPTGW